MHLSSFHWPEEAIPKNVTLDIASVMVMEDLSHKLHHLQR